MTRLCNSALAFTPTVALATVAANSVPHPCGACHPASQAYVSAPAHQSRAAMHRTPIVRGPSRLGLLPHSPSGSAEGRKTAPFKTSFG